MDNTNWLVGAPYHIERPLNEFDVGWFEMSDMKQWHWEATKYFLPDIKTFEEVANDLCENALNDAKAELHPLIRNNELTHLRKRSEFVQAFKLALERRIAQKLAAWQPSVQAVFKFDESWMENRESWDGSIHLLVKVPHLSNAMQTFGKKLDRSLTHCLQQLGWSRFRKRQSILDVQQVTLNELRHGIGYGAMFYAVYNTPVKVWPLKGPTS
jgi:hypothetical protein